MVNKSMRRVAYVFLMFFTLSTSSLSFAAGATGAAVENPGGIAMAADAVIVRPLSLVATAVGAVLWVVTLPFSLLGGNSGQAADTLVLTPLESTFFRCLGCTSSGYRHTTDTDGE